MSTHKRLLTIVFASVSMLALGTLLSLGGTALAMPPAQGVTPTGVTIPYLGRLLDASGQAMPDSVYDFTFSLYDAAEGGTVLWSETQYGVTVYGGDLTTSLGSMTALSKEVSERKELWLAVSVRGPGETEFTLLNPRQKFNAGPAAVSALSCPHSHFTDDWSGSTTGYYGLRVNNTGTGDGIRAYSASSTTNYAAIWAVNLASTGYGTAVYGSSGKGLGVYAYSGAGDALEATTGSTTKSAIYAHAANANGVWAISTNKQGVHGGSTNNFGVEATGGGDTSWSDLIGDLLIGGNRGEVFAPGDVLALYSNGFIALDLDNNNNGANQFEIWNGADSLVFTVNESGNMAASGTKSAMVQTADYGKRLLYAIESPEVRFEDIGTAELANGVATVTFDAIFAQAVNLKIDYQVFVTPVCKEPVLLYVTDKTASGFIVQGVTLKNEPSDCAFDYRIVAKRLGYETIRMEPANTRPNSKQGAQP